jgi:hypothetical protein
VGGRAHIFGVSLTGAKLCISCEARSSILAFTIITPQREADVSFAPPELSLVGAA